ncbi:DUF3800 domain-containing protein [Bifidobacterium sp. ESL0745]|uniref:DUF3800 domain-containing protein n=1 Tax=Bifidobacterium sp. ESL0745 TaxID=2983226 RepID=UPI0023F714AE|nr:DUF3800 domain-containing protein [Bifidobacterium sp. ESL0745]MDF7665132.1 DUF3800 domain-containing protein [Bifidobacterium sp. ESL0745]
MGALSIFIDESGDFGAYDSRTPYYIVAMVLHNQDNSIEANLASLDEQLQHDNLRTGSIHTRPLVRHEDEYFDLSVQERRLLLSRLYLFAKNCNLKYRMFVFERRMCRTPDSLAKAISIAITDFVVENQQLFRGFDSTVIYYDDGQKQLAKIISQLDSLIPNVDHRHVAAANYQQYRLAQVADLACCLQLSKLHYETNTPTNSELLVFGKWREFKKNYYKTFARKQLR